MLITRNQLAELRGCTPSTISRHPELPRTGKGKVIKFDLSDPAVWAFVIEPDKEQWERERQSESDIPEGDGTLNDEKTKAEIALKKKQARKFDYEYQQQTKKLIPVELMTLWIGAFRAGIETNFLTIGNKIARGNIELRDRIEKEIGKAIQKTKEGAAKALREESEAILEAINGTEEGK